MGVWVSIYQVWHMWVFFLVAICLHAWMDSRSSCLFFVTRCTLEEADKLNAASIPKCS